MYIYFQNPAKFARTKLVEMKNLTKYNKKILYKSALHFSEKTAEVTQHPVEVVERYPLQVGSTILQLSKLIMMRFVVFLYEFLEKGSFEAVYTGNL